MEELKRILTLIQKEKVKTEETSDDKNFNIFNILKIEQNEVLICRLIGGILDPKGSHKMGAWPLQLFFEMVLNKKDDDEESIKDAKVHLEEMITRDGSNRRVDIVIHTRKGVYPIEVKIWAGDQEKQLSDYYHYYFGDDKGKIYYLTPDGHEPSEYSYYDLDISSQVVLLSFKENMKNTDRKSIIEWLKCVEKKCNEDRTAVIILQFQEVIEKMGNDRHIVEKIKDEVSFDNPKEEDLERINALGLICRNADDIMKDIQIKYLKRTIQCKPEYELKEIIERNRPNPWGKYALLFIEKDDDPHSQIWLGVDGEGLFLFTRNNITVTGQEWEKDAGYHWIRIKRNSSDTVNLREFSDTSVIDISDVLKSIE